jgi:hypothetical protein
VLDTLHSSGLAATASVYTLATALLLLLLLLLDLSSSSSSSAFPLLLLICCSSTFLTHNLAGQCGRHRD